MSFVTALEAIRKLDGSLYVVTLPDGTDVIFTLPSLNQASQYSQLLTVSDGNYSLQCIIYNHIFEEYVVDKFFAVHDENIKAGIPETIAKVIMYLSGSDNDSFQEYTETLLDTFRSQTSNVISVMKRTICQVFSGYKMNDVDRLSFQDLVKVYVEAEKVLLEQGIIEEGLKFKEQEKPKPFTIESTISKDFRDYQQFEAPEGGQEDRLTNDPAYKAKMEEFRIKQRLRQKQGG